MKKSAFQVFNAKKKKEKSSAPSSTNKKPPSGDGSLRRAQSVQSVNSKSAKKDSGSKSKRFFVNIRESMRLSNSRKRPHESNVKSDSPMTALKQISLVGPKPDSAEKPKARKNILESNDVSKIIETTPKMRKSPKNRKLKVTENAGKTRSMMSLPSESTDTKQTSNKVERSKSSSSLQALPKVKMSIEKKMKRRSESKSPRTNSVKKRKLDPSKQAKKDRPDFMKNSSVDAEKMFECIIHPVETERFFGELWEKKPLLVKRHKREYNKGWFSTAEFDKILRQENIEWGVNLDATSFVDDKRETHNQNGRAYAPVVWDMYQAGCSLRLLNPQTYSKNVWKVLSLLQEYFGCCVGANIYLTPPGTQGFAPHYDDIEAFIIQLEGKKHWRLYGPRHDGEVLPRFSSDNFSQSDVGEPILDTILEAGDMLYFPRGTIHQGDATDEHSLHITVSCYQMNTWGDLMQKLLPAAIDMAITENPDFREGLPRDYLNYMGIVNSEKTCSERIDFIQKLESLVKTMLDKHFPIDAAVDQMGKQLMHDSLPPVLSRAEKVCTVNEGGERWDPLLFRVVGVSEILPTTEIKLVRKGILRLLTEDEKIVVYYCSNNPRLYHGQPPLSFEVTAEQAPAVEHLINSYPTFVTVESLPMENLADQMNLVSILYERGLLITSKPLETTYDEPGDETSDADDIE